MAKRSIQFAFVLVYLIENMFNLANVTVCTAKLINCPGGKAESIPPLLRLTPMAERRNSNPKRILGFEALLGLEAIYTEI